MTTDDLPSLAELRSAELRGTVADAWQCCLDAGPFATVREVPQTASFSFRSLADHTNEVANTALWLCDESERTYGLGVDREVVLAAAILHDVDKAIILERSASGDVRYRDGYSAADHGAVGAQVALDCGVPAAIATLVRDHPPFNDSDHLPGTPEGLILHYADLLCADFGALQVGGAPIFATSRLVRDPR